MTSWPCSKQPQLWSAFWDVSVPCSHNRSDRRQQARLWVQQSRGATLATVTRPRGRSGIWRMPGARQAERQMRCMRALPLPPLLNCHPQRESKSLALATLPHAMSFQAASVPVEMMRSQLSIRASHLTSCVHLCSGSGHISSQSW